MGDFLLLLLKRNWYADGNFHYFSEKINAFILLKIEKQSYKIMTEAFVQSLSNSRKAMKFNYIQPNFVD